MSAHKNIHIGMLGCGVVGGQVAALLEKNNAELSTRAGAKLVLKKIAVRDVKSAREGVNPALLTTDAQSIINDPEIDIVIEVMGGIDPARELILAAINNGKSVVTANKALLATHGADLFTAAADAEVFPVDAQITALEPSSAAFDIAIVIPRSLKDPVGFRPSYLIQTLFFNNSDK